MTTARFTALLLMLLPATCITATPKKLIAANSVPIGTRGCSFEPKTIATCDVAAGDSGTLAACLAQGATRVRAKAGLYQIEETLQIASHTILEKVFDGTNSVIDIKPASSFDMSSPVMISISGVEQVLIRGELFVDGFGAAGGNLQTGIVIKASQSISVTDTTLPRYTGGNAVHVIDSECIGLHVLDIMEIQHFYPGNCSDIVTGGGAVRVEQSARIALNGIHAHALSRSGIIAINSTDLSIRRTELGDIAPPGNCQGYGIGIGIDLLPDVTGFAGAPLYIDNFVSTAPIYGTGMYIETSGAGNADVQISSAKVTLNPTNAPLVWDGYYVCSASQPQPAFVDVLKSSTNQGDIRSTILPLPSANTNVCNNAGCVYPAYSCGDVPNYWW